MSVRPLAGSIQFYPDESLTSGIARAADLNCVPNPSTLMKESGIGYKRADYLQFTAASSIQPIASLLGVEAKSVRERMLTGTDKFSRFGSVSWFGTTIERRLLDPATRRYSPAGFNKAPYGRLSWMVRPLAFCPVTFERLQEYCGHCRAPLGWTRCLGVAVCEHCERPLNAAVDSLPEEAREDYQSLAGLVDVDENVRRASLDRLPPPFREWEPGIAFSAIIELSALSQCTEAADPPQLWDTLNRGEFSVLGDTGIVAGWRLLADWPHGFDALLIRTLRARRHLGKRKLVLGAFDRYCSSRAKHWQFADEVRGRVASAIEAERIPFKQSATSSGVIPERVNQITLWDARIEFQVGVNILRQFAKNGDCLIERMSGVTGIYLFDRERLAAAIGRYKAGVLLLDFARVLGVPPYAIGSLVGRGLIKTIPEHRHDDPSANTVLEAESVNSFFTTLANLSCLEKATSREVCLSDSLGSVLSPLAWCDAYHDILLGRLRAKLQEGQGNWSSRIFVQKAAMTKLLKNVASKPLPDIGISAQAASSIIGLNGGVLGQAVEAGLITRSREGLRLPSLAAFRSQHMFPTEISRRFGISGLACARTMKAHGYEPVAVLHKVNIWRRADIIEVFGESAQMKFQSI